MQISTIELLPDSNLTSDGCQMLIIFDGLCTFSDLSHFPISLLKSPNVHIAVISRQSQYPKSLQKEIDHNLLRGCTVHDVKPLSIIHSSQRIVHSILSNYHLAPTNDDQTSINTLSNLTYGSPDLVNLVSALISLLTEMNDSDDDPAHKSLQDIAMALESDTPATLSSYCPAGENCQPQVVKGQVPANEKSNTSTLGEIAKSGDKESNEGHDSWDSVVTFLTLAQLCEEEMLLLNCLSVFNCAPIPLCVVQEISGLICKAAHKLHLAGNLHSNLMKLKVLKQYPSPVVFHPSLEAKKENGTAFFYVPQFIASALWSEVMVDTDKVVVLGVLYKALISLQRLNSDVIERKFVHGLCWILLGVYESNYSLMGKECFQVVYQMCLSFDCNKVL